MSTLEQTIDCSVDLKTLQYLVDIGIHILSISLCNNNRVDHDKLENIVFYSSSTFH